MKLIKSIYFFTEKIYSYFLRKNLKNKNFTIISNNCFGGSVYEDLHVQYQTPTIGLFFYAPCYIKFVKDFKKYINTPLKFKEKSFYDKANDKRERMYYPIGVLDDIEIQFLHYENEKEAFEKWNRRIKRINPANIFFVFSDRDLCTKEHLLEFDNLPYENKIIFTSKHHPELKSAVWLKTYKNDKMVGDLYKYRWSYRVYFNVVRWLNNSKST